MNCGTASWLFMSLFELVNGFSVSGRNIKSVWVVVSGNCCCRRYPIMPRLKYITNSMWSFSFDMLGHGVRAEKVAWHCQLHSSGDVLSPWKVMGDSFPSQDQILYTNTIQLFYNYLLQDMTFCSAYASCFLSGKKKCRSLTEVPTPEWHGWVGFHL